MRLALPQVTLVAVDTRAPQLAAEALLHSMSRVDFGRVVLFTGDWMPQRIVPGLEIVQIAPLGSGADYSRFVLRELPGYINTSHVLVTQWDGFVADAAGWSHEFLNYDYIGAVWPEQPEGRNVGNGGFSLRSRRLLMAGRDPRITQEHPEDEVLCRQQRGFLEREHGVQFAPAPLARRFAFENQRTASPAFGFHGPYHLPRVLDERTLRRWLRAMPDEFFRCRDARRMARALLAQRMPVAADELLARRQAAGRTDPNTRLLSAAASLLGLFSPAVGAADKGSP